MPKENIADHRWPMVIMANSLPVRRAKTKGQATWEMSPGGLVSALKPFVEKAGGAWIGWTGTAGRAPDPFMHESIANIPVPINAAELKGFYQGVCNRTLWPLYHDAIRPAEYHRHWWIHYVEVNRRFAEAAAKAVAPGGLVWVHDYHLHLVPRMLRELRGDIRIGFFLHIPFPPEELFQRLPWRRQILEGTLGADVVGFQTKAGAQNFMRLAQHHSGTRGRGSRLQVGDRSVHVGVFPISIDYERYESTARHPAVINHSDQLRKNLGLGRRIVLGVDRLDYTKGIDVRVKAFGELLSKGMQTIHDTVLVQVAVPSRERIEEYQELRSSVEELVGQINGRFGEVGIAPVHYLRRNLPFEELVAMYRAADVMLVTPFCDGMNLVAKEYIATRFDNTGVLILSEFAGAAPELRNSVLVNPHDVDGLAEAIHRGLTMSSKNAKRSMRAMRRVIRRNTVHDWARSFMKALRKD
ncbi:MAG: trehalose-6-phosphate synthase [Gemmatimonadota bacterium]|nr:MAG: trehalose-6-phosphate synthase [Gemmatimonadota bacterium]